MKSKIAVIADDITGAAEIAGIAHSYGLRTVLTTDVPDTIGGDADVIVIATDTRSCTPEEAYSTTAAITRKIVKHFSDGTVDASQCAGNGNTLTLFHKTDSALRGHVAEELRAISEAYRGGIYLPANPSKGRIIRHGIYYVSDTPIHETAFRYDPEFPALTSNVHDRFPTLTIPDATCHDDIHDAVRHALTDGKVLAGAADLFTALLEQLLPCSHRIPDAGDITLPSGTPAVIVLGSTQSKLPPIDVAVMAMPDDIFWQRTSQPWHPYIAERQSVALTIGDKPILEGKSAAVRLRTTMAEACCHILDSKAAQSPREDQWLIIEGGATAYAILSRTQYRTFEIERQYAPGVVCMKSTDTPHRPTLYIILKPGSYPWRNSFTIPGDTSCCP